MALQQRFKLIFYAPASALDVCKTAVFAAGAGRYPGPGGYTECAFVSKGMGQFRPGDAAKPHIGQPGHLTFVQEMRIETVCIGKEVTKEAIIALKRVHPYEEVAYEVFALEDF